MIELVKLSDKELYSVIAPPAEHEVTHEDLYTLFPKYEDELKKVGVTKLMLWEKYKSEYSHGVQYSQFCDHFNNCLYLYPVFLKSSIKNGSLWAGIGGSL